MSMNYRILLFSNCSKMTVKFIFIDQAALGHMQSIIFTGSIYEILEYKPYFIAMLSII